MKLTVFGASGTIGQRIVEEALSRGHEVLAVARNISKLSIQHSKLKTKTGDLLDSNTVKEISSGSDAVISAYGPGSEQADNLSKAASSLLEGTNIVGVPVYFVGGAGSLEVAPNLQLVDTPSFPAEYKKVAMAHRDALQLIQDSKFNHWTYLSPAAYIYPGEKLGKYRLGQDQLLKDSEGNSKISAEDYALALLDEVESPKHKGKRFTVAY